MSAQKRLNYALENGLRGWATAELKVADQRQWLKDGILENSRTGRTEAPVDTQTRVEAIVRAASDAHDWALAHLRSLPPESRVKVACDLMIW